MTANQMAELLLDTLASEELPNASASPCVGAELANKKTRMHRAMIAKAYTNLSANQTLDMPVLQSLLAPLTDLVVEAGDAILAISRGRDLSVQGKADGSPVTAADLAADRIIVDGLAGLCPNIPVLSEERAEQMERPISGNFFVVDPLDGTKEFIHDRLEYTVNIGLISNGVPVLGLVGAPALGLIWRGVVGSGAERVTLREDGSAEITSIHTRPLPANGQLWIATVSRSHGDPESEAFIDARPHVERRRLGSAVKFGHIAEGTADIYPRLSPTSEWDVAAGHAVLVAAGGKVTDRSGGEIRYGGLRDKFIIPDFIGWGDADAR